MKRVPTRLRSQMAFRSGAIARGLLDLNPAVKDMTITRSSGRSWSTKAMAARRMSAALAQSNHWCR